MERLRGLPVAYARALKIPLSESETTRVQKWASPTTSQRAFEAFVRGQEAAYRGGQEGNEVAVELMGKAIEIDPQFVVAQYTLGAVHQNLGNRWKAAAQFRASTQLDAAYPEPYKALGDLFLTAPQRPFDQAIEAYAKALEIRPFFADAHVGLGDAKAAKGDVDGAVVAYQKALGFNPLNAKVHVSLGSFTLRRRGCTTSRCRPTRRPSSWTAAFSTRAWDWRRSTRTRGCIKRRSANTARWWRRTAEEYGRALQSRPRLREGGCQGVDLALGALYSARQSAPVREGLGRRSQAAPQEAAQSAGKEQLGPRGRSA